MTMSKNEGTRPRDYLSRLDALNKKFEKDIAAQAEEFRRLCLIQICQKFHLNFYSGNGDFFFTTEDGIDYASVSRQKYPDMSADLRGALTPLMMALYYPIGSASSDMFGFYVENFIYEK